MSKISPQLDYTIKEGSYSKPLPLRVPSVDDIDVVLNGSNAYFSTFEVQCENKVINFASMKLQTAIESAGVALKNVYMFTDVPSEIYRIRAYTESSIVLCDIPYLPFYMASVGRLSTKLTDMKSRDRIAELGLTPAATKYVKDCFAPVQGLSLASSALVAGTTRYNGELLSDEFIEGSYIASNSDVIGQTMGYEMSFSFRSIPNTIFQVDKPLLMKENITIEIYWNDVGSAFWSSATTAVWTEATPLPDDNVSLRNPYILVDFETNPLVIAALRAAPVQVLLPVIKHKSRNIPAAATTADVMTKIGKGYGDTITGVYVAPFFPDGSFGITHLHQNKVFGAGNDSKMVTSYDISVAGVSRTGQVDETKDEGWERSKDYLSGSMLCSSNVYDYNWIIWQDFTGRKRSTDLLDKRDGKPTGVPWDINFHLDLTGTDAVDFHQWVVGQQVITFG